MSRAHAVSIIGKAGDEAAHLAMAASSCWCMLSWSRSDTASAASASAVDPDGAWTGVAVSSLLRSSSSFLACTVMYSCELCAGMGHSDSRPSSSALMPSSTQAKHYLQSFAHILCLTLAHTTT